MWCGGTPVMSAPSKTSCRRSARRCGSIRLKIVVLPAPFGPMMVKTSPCSTSKLTPSTARMPPKLIARFVGREEAHRRRSDRM